MKDNKKIKLFYIFLIIQPLLDLFTSLMVRYVEFPLTVGMFIRGAFIFAMILYLFFFNHSKYKRKSIIYIMLIGVFCILYLLFKEGIFTFSFIKTEIIYMFKYMYFPITSICFVNLFDEYNIKKDKICNIMIFEVIIYSLLIIIPEVFGTSFSSYIGTNKGTVGWFYAANEIGALMVALFPFMYYLLYKKNNTFIILILLIIVILAMTLLGTKTAFIGMLITEIVFLIYYLFNIKKDKGYGLKISIIILIISYLLLPNIPAVKNLQTSIKQSSIVVEEKNETSEIENNIKQNDNNITVTTKKDEIFKALLSGRNEFYNRTSNIYKISSFDNKILGIGFVNRNEINNKNIEKLIEIDPLDIFFHYGVIGFVIYFLPLFVIIFKTFIYVVKNKFHFSYYLFTSLYVTGLLLVISMIAGHVFSAPAVSIYSSLAFAILSSELDNNKNIKKKNKKKITILALHLGFGGVEKYLSSLCKMLENNFEIELIVTYKLLEKPAFEFSNNIQIKYLLNYGPNKDDFSEALNNKNIYKILKEGMKGIKILFLKKIRNIYAIRNIESDYIITTRDFHNKLVSQCADKSIIKIATEHNFHNNDKKYVNKLIQSIKDFDYFIVVSKNLKEYYQDKIGKTKCVYIPNVIDSIPINKSKLDKKNIITVGRLSPEKGQKDLIDVFKIVNSKLPKTKLFVVGDGILKEELINYSNKLKLNKNIIFTGFLDKKNKEKYIYDSSVFVLPSFTESFGLVLIEAMSYGLPCVAFDSADGAKELLQNGNGILIKNRNKEDMARKIIQILTDKKRNNIADKGYKSCQKYIAENVKKKWLQILK